MVLFSHDQDSYSLNLLKLHQNKIQMWLQFAVAIVTNANDSHSNVGTEVERMPNHIPVLFEC